MYGKLWIHVAITLWTYSYYSDNVMIKSMITNRTDAWKTDVKFVFYDNKKWNCLLTCWCFSKITNSCVRPQLTMKTSQCMCKSSCSYCKKINWILFHNAINDFSVTELKLVGWSFCKWTICESTCGTMHQKVLIYVYNLSNYFLMLS